MTKTATVKELAEQIRGVSYAKNDASNTPGPGLVPVLRAGNITDNGLVCDRDLVYVPQSKVSPKQRIRKFDIVIAASSGSISIVGKAAQAQEDLAGSFGAFCKVLRPNASVEPNYFSHYFKTPSYRRHVSSLAAGANINNLRNQDLDDLLIPLPPLSEQKRIAEILDRTESLRRQRRAALALLDELTQSIFLDMFGDPVSNPKGFPDTELYSLIRENDRLNYGVVQPGDDVADGGVPLVRVGDLAHGKIDCRNLKRISESIESAYKRSRLQGDEILISCVGSIGEIALVDASQRGFNIARAVARVPLADGHCREYVAEYFKSQRVQRYFKDELRTVSQPTLNIKQIGETRVLLPPLPLQLEFSKRRTGVENLKVRLSESQAELDSLFASLQHRAFRGEL